MNEQLAYLVDSSLWSMGGLILGWLAGRTSMEVHQIYKKVVQDDRKE